MMRRMQIPYRKPGKFSQMKTDPVVTPGKFAELTKKLEKLKTVSRPRAAAEVARLAELGDFSENAEYQLAKGKLRGINSAIIFLESQITNAEIIKGNQGTGTVQLGSTVTVLVGEAQKTFQILGSTETNPTKGIISHNSPIGSALMGRKVGDEVKIKLDNREVAYTIVKVE
jgi:transcription elongation factor GreA